MNPGDNKKSVTEALWSWLKGDLRNREEQALYRAADEDPFLKDAIEGYQRFPEGKHTDKIESLKARLNKKKKRGIILPIRIAAAAASIMIVTASVWWIFQPAQADIASNEQTEQVDALKESDDSFRPTVADEAEMPEVSAAEETEVASEEGEKLITKQLSPEKPVVISPESIEDLKSDAEVVEEEIAMDVSPSPPPIAPEVEKVPPSPAVAAPKKIEMPTSPKIENAGGREQATSEGKRKEENALYLKKSNSANSRARQTPPPNAYDLSAQQELSAFNPETQPAQPLGGFVALENYLDTTWRQSWLSDTLALQGAFIGVEFRVRKNGSLTDFSIVQSHSSSKDTALINALKKGPKWEYVNQSVQQPVKVQYRFSLIKN